MSDYDRQFWEETSNRDSSSEEGSASTITSGRMGSTTQSSEESTGTSQLELTDEEAQTDQQNPPVLDLTKTGDQPELVGEKLVDGVNDQGLPSVASNGRSSGAINQGPPVPEENGPANKPRRPKSTVGTRASQVPAPALTPAGTRREPERGMTEEELQDSIRPVDSISNEGRRSQASSAHSRSSVNVLKVKFKHVKRRQEMEEQQLRLRAEQEEQQLRLRVRQELSGQLEAAEVLLVEAEESGDHQAAADARELLQILEAEINQGGDVGGIIKKTNDPNKVKSSARQENEEIHQQFTAVCLPMSTPKPETSRKAALDRRIKTPAALSNPVPGPSEIPPPRPTPAPRRKISKTEAPTRETAAPPWSRRRQPSEETFVAVDSQVALR